MEEMKSDCCGAEIEKSKPWTVLDLHKKRRTYYYAVCSKCKKSCKPVAKEKENE